MRRAYTSWTMKWIALPAVMLALAACATARHAKDPQRAAAYAALPASCEKKLDVDLAVQMYRSKADAFWVFVDFAGRETRGAFRPFEIASCTGGDCVLYLPRARIFQLCDDGIVREISRTTDEE